MKMIDKITSFFSHQKKNSYLIHLYLTQDKSEFITIELTPEKTISQIYLENINQISVIQAKLSQKKELIKKGQYCFTLFNEKDPYIRIKLKNSTILWQKLERINLIENYLLFYLFNENYYSNNNKYNSIIRRLNNLTNNKRNEEENLDKQFSNETYIINFISPNNKIIDGEIEKFSFSQNAFNKIFIYIDSNKLMYKELSSLSSSNNKENKSNNLKNLWNVIPLANISTVNINSLKDINIDTSYSDINLYKDRIFTIKTFNNENILFKTYDKSDKEIWFNAIKNIVERVRSDKLFFKFNKENNENIKKIYMTLLKFISKLINIKGIICFQNLRKFIFRNYKNIGLEEIVQCCVEYKLNVNKKNKNKAIDEIYKLKKILDLNISLDFDMNKNIKRVKTFIQDEEKEKLKELLDKETYTKLINLIKSLQINKNFFSLKLDLNLLDNLLQNIINKYLIKEHKKILHENKYDFINNIKKTTAIQFCKNNNFNCNKMNVLFKENMKINIKKANSDSDFGIFYHCHSNFYKKFNKNCKNYNFK